MEKKKEEHVCKYSKSMNQPYPRLCVICGKPEPKIINEEEIDEFWLKIKNNIHE